MQRTIFSKLDEVKQEPKLASDVEARLAGLAEAVGNINQKLHELQETTHQCQRKVEESGEKLETVRTGLEDFAADMHSWIHGTEGSDVDRGTEKDGEAFVAVALGIPESPVEEMDLLRYVDD